jgi:hypothetical protein
MKYLDMLLLMEDNATGIVQVETLGRQKAKEILEMIK